MKVSIVLPAYQHEKFIGPAIDSVLSQSFVDFELLIGDDASKDKTADVINSYQDSRIRFYPHHTNYGATFNHRFLLEKAKGDYIALINSDDLWLPGKLEKQVQYLDQHPETVLCSGWAKFIDEDGADLDLGGNVFQQPNRTQAEWIEYFFMHGNCICHPAVLIRREAYEQLSYYRLALRQLPDFEMWTRMIRLGEFYIFQEPLAAHRRFIKSGENTSAPKRENSMRDVMESYYVLSEYLEDMEDELFCKAFRKYFRKQSASSHEELICERYFLLESGKYYMADITKQAAIMYFIRNYTMPVAKVLRNSYGYTLNDFYKVSCQVDLLGLMSQREKMEQYIQMHRKKTLCMALFGKDSAIYRWAEKTFGR
ncbi:MAG: glycosyltransferase [Oscillospiraceae bacterium]|nr:glycosyltransferase [Oscillospiraceae bacterium]